MKVWDPFIRIFHWSLVTCVLSNRFLNESGGLWHERLGYFACVLIGFRLVWGVFGPRYARFSDISKNWPPRGQFGSYIRAYCAGRTPRVLNHSPPAVIVMSAMLLSVLVLGLSGWMMSWELFFGEDWLAEVHEVFSHILIILAAIHVAGVLRESVLHRENLVLSMIHGKKRP